MMLYFVTLLIFKTMGFALFVAFAALCYRTFDAMREPRLKKWHRFSQQEISVAEMRTLDWDGYQKRENDLFEAFYRSIEKMSAPQENPPSRYVISSPNYPPRFERDWNRSFLMQPKGDVHGAAIFLHGLTDSPYTLRHLAKHYTERGFLSYGLRIPGHGTSPASLAETCWEQWLASVRMAVRDAQARRPANTPLHLIGFSNGGALAVKYALDAIADPLLPQADQLVLIAPMIGVFPLARFAKLAALPAHIPGLGKSAWLIVAPEYNPFKYNSMHVNVAHQSYRLSNTIKKQIALLAKSKQLNHAPSVLTFQSVEDTTVSTFAIVSSLYAHLPANDSELVFFDVKRRELLHPAEATAYNTVIRQMHPKPPQNYEFTIVSKVAGENRVRERVYDVLSARPRERAFPVFFPKTYTSLPHFSLPSPITDSLYGFEPENGREFGINLEEMKANKQGARGLLSTDSLFRLGSNPLFPYMLERIDRQLPFRE